MPAITKKHIETLVKVQQIEIESAKIKAYLADLPTRIKNLEGELEAYISSVNRDRAAVEDYNKKYRELEADMQENLTKIQKSQEKLRAVKTNKEYQSGLKEIDDINSANSKLEDEMLAILEQVDQAELALKDREQHYNEIVDESNREKAAIEKDAEIHQKELMELEAEHSEFIRDVDVGVLDVFNRVKAKQMNRVGIVAVLDAVCQGCNMNIPPQVYNELQRYDKLRYCPSCDRIIYWQKADEGSE